MNFRCNPHVNDRKPTDAQPRGEIAGERKRARLPDREHGTSRYGPAERARLVQTAKATGGGEPPASVGNSSTRKNETRSSIACACCSSVLAVAAFSSTSAEFCCVTSSIWVSALLI